MSDRRAPPYSELPEGIPPMPHMDRGLDASRAAAHAYLDAEGYDKAGRVELPVAWGEVDIFKHINNVAYVRYLESSRMRWLASLAPEMGQQQADDFVNGRGMGIILKDYTVRFRAPVTYPDSIIWAAMPRDIDQKKACFTLSHAGWSVKDNRLVLTCDATIVIYDHTNTRKGVMSDHLRDVLLKRAAGKSKTKL